MQESEAQPSLKMIRPPLRALRRTDFRCSVTGKSVSFRADVCLCLSSLHNASREKKGCLPESAAFVARSRQSSALERSSAVPMSFSSSPRGSRRRQPADAGPRDADRGRRRGPVVHWSLALLVLAKCRCASLVALVCGRVERPPSHVLAPRHRASLAGSTRPTAMVSTFKAPAAASRRSARSKRQARHGTRTRRSGSGSLGSAARGLEGTRLDPGMAGLKHGEAAAQASPGWAEVSGRLAVAKLLCAA